jgi:hypothetical protein
MESNGAWYPLSDARLKKDTRNVENALDKVTRLNGVTWTWKDSRRGSRPQMGVIAQDVEQVAPELVAEPIAGLKGVNYGGLNALTIEAIKELKRQNDEQRARIDSLEKRLESLEGVLKTRAGDQHLEAR